METNDLFDERKCPQCGNMFKKAATFCPHCGYVKEHSWLDDIGDLFGGSSSPSPSSGRSSSASMVSVVIAVLFGSYLLIDAVRKESLMGMIAAGIAFLVALRAWWASRRTQEQPTMHDESKEEQIAVHEETPSDIVSSQKFFCENCGTEVREDAAECQKCGMKFG